MSKNKFQKLSENIVNYIGSKDNVTYFVHCVTRLRFNLKDKSLSKPEEIEKLPGVLGCQWPVSYTHLKSNPRIRLGNSHEKDKDSRFS